MNDDCESLKIKSTVYGNEEIKPRIFNTERKKNGFENNSTKSHFKTWPKLNLYVDSIDFQTLRKT